MKTKKIKKINFLKGESRKLKLKLFKNKYNLYEIH